MNTDEAYRIARKALAENYEIERATVDGASIMIPTNRDRITGKALKEADQEAADAYNWLARPRVGRTGH